MLAAAKNPVILAGSGAVDSAAAGEIRRIARALGAPVATTYLHTDAFPSDDELAVGPIGYQGSKAAMRLIARLGYLDYSVTDEVFTLKRPD